ncbi:MAG: mechanosensitive ion channel family protein [candidate division WOR-3 bacterium]|nr:mechanosensitive ion channel family protein [candidate division WOR-3 bacterium]
MVWRELLAGLRGKLVTPEKLAVTLSKLIDIVLIVAGAMLIYALARVLARRLLKVTRARRAATYINVVRSIMGYVIFFFVLVLILRVFGVNYTAILAGAGVLGLAVGFGAQTLIRDFISGFFLLLEDLIRVGDYITVGDVEGTVEVVGMRVSKVRAFNGTLHVVPNGELTRFGNQSRGHMRAIVAFDLAYEQDAAKGLALAREVAEQWAKDNADEVIESPVVAGLLRFGESGVQVRVAVKVRPGQQWAAEQGLRLALKQSFDAAGTEIPFSRRVVYLRSDSEAGPQPKS